MSKMADAKLPCQKCGHMLDVKILEAPRLINMENVSMAVISHSDVMRCPSCREMVQLAMVGIQNVMFQMLPVPSQSAIVKPGMMGLT